MNYEIELTEGLNNPEKAKQVIKEVQDAIDEMVKTNQELLKMTEDANKIAAEYEEQTTLLHKTSSDLSDALKAIFSIMGKKKELWKNDEEINVIMDTLATFVLGSGTIKLGVIGKGLK